ncbi:MAG: hypothetical protein AMJ61_05440 [Desulfobacterales bacterium SG8_35_2]|jgi:hypothetical protein|nr:MAG: hypothetical protein AMJ61_05440 [Desulfobacterales bacterium SG8_35_2]
MSGIIKDFALTALVIILNHWIYGIDDAIAYGFIVNIIVKNRTLFIASGLGGSFILLISSSMFESLGLYKITYGLSKILIRVSQFLITFFAILYIVFYAALGNNLMRDNGYLLMFSLALILGASCWALRIIDFNHPTRNDVLPVSALFLMAILLVEFVWPYYNF